MKRTAFALTLVVALLSSAVTGAMLVNFGEANFIPFPSEPSSPTISIQSPERNKTYAQNNVEVSFDVKEPGSWDTIYINPRSWGIINWIRIGLDGQEIPSFNKTRMPNKSDDQFTEKCSATLVGLSEGMHNLTISVSSTTNYRPANESWYEPATAGTLINSSSVIFAVDAFTPSISILTITIKSTEPHDTTLYFTVSEPAAWMGYSLDEQENVTLTGNSTLSDLSKGMHNVTVYANDTFGNMGTSGTIAFIVSEPFPTVLIGAVTVIVVVVVGASLLFYFRRRKRSENT